MFKTIVVGHGGSSNADPALELARSLALRDESRVLVVYVVEFTAGRGGGYPAHADEPQTRARLEEKVRALIAEGINAELVVRPTVSSGPAHVIADAAKDAKADLIVVATRGRSALAQVVVGGVSVRLLHLAHCPVLVAQSPKH